MSYSTDNEGRVISVCRDDLSGCSDWYAGDIGLSPEDDIYDDHGACLYKVVDGHAVVRSVEERMLDWPEETQPEDEPTADDYRDALNKLGVEI